MQFCLRAEKRDDLSLREKPNKEFYQRPYHKPTQVGWWSTPRQTSKGGSRNSAKKLSVSYAICSVPPSGTATKVYQPTV